MEGRSVQRCQLLHGVLLPYQLLTPSYVHTGTHLAPDVTANRKPSNDQRTSSAARSMRRMTSAGFHAPMSGSKVHTKAFLSCEQDTILLFTGDQSTAVTSRSCCRIGRMKVDSQADEQQYHHSFTWICMLIIASSSSSTASYLSEDMQSDPSSGLVDMDLVVVGRDSDH